MHTFHQPLRRLGWLMVLLLVITGCGATRPPANVIGQLGPDGGWLEGPNGLAVSLVEGAIDTSITVVLEPVAQPPLPLPSGIQPIGEAYRISADQDVPTSEPFVLIIPLPEGVDPAELAIAVYHPGNAPHVPDPMWFRIPGAIATELGAFLVQLPSLPEDGLIFLLVRDTAAELPTTADGGIRATGNLGSTWLSSGRAIVTPKNAFSNTAVAAFESAMNDILNLYRRSKLRPPLLQVVGAKPITKGWGTPVRMDYSSASYGFYMMPTGAGECGSKVLGFYDPRTNIMVVCAPADGSMSALMQRTLVHEIFHAVQKRYGKYARWWAESTAALSENSIQDTAFQPQLTPDYGPRNTWLPLQYWEYGKLIQYETQDFWYHVLRERGLAFDAAMDAYMRHPMTLAGTNDALGGKLADEYWHWFKDQTYVKGAATARPDTACRPDPDTAVTVVQLNANTTSETFVDHKYKRYTLSGVVFRYKLPNTEPFPVTWRLWFTASGNPLTPSDRTAIDTQAWSCSWQASPTEIRVQPGQTLESGALVANVDLSAAKDDRAIWVGDGKPYRLHAKPLRGKVSLDGPSGGLSITVTELSSLASMSYALTETSPGSGTYLIALPVGNYDISASGSGGYTATYRNVAVQEDTTVAPTPEDPPGREIVFLGRSSGGALNLYLWDLDRGTVRALTSFTDDTWANPATQALSFAAVRTAAGDLVAVILQDPGSNGTEVLYRLDLATSQAVPVANLPGSYQLSRVNLSFRESGPAALRYFEDTLGTRQLQMVDLLTGEVVWTADVSSYATQCGWRPGRSVWAGGYLLGCGNMDSSSNWTALVAAIPSPLGGYQGTIAHNPAFMQFEGPADFGGIEFGNSMIFVERALYPDFSEATGFIVDANTTTSSFVALPGETPYGCSPAPKLMQVACLRTSGVVVHTVDSTGAITQSESFALPGGYTIYTDQLDAIDFVEPLER